jgi:hypothetical protein
VRPGAGCKLQSPQTLLDRSDRPARIRGQTFDGLARIIERTDVAELDGVFLSILDPPERKPLGSADVGTVGVDSTSSLLVEKGAGAFGMRYTGDEKLHVMAADLLGLHVEDRQPIDATRAAAAPALQSRRVKDVQPVRRSIDVCMQNGDGVRAPIRAGHEMLSLVGMLSWKAADCDSNARAAGPRACAKQSP